MILSLSLTTTSQSVQRICVGDRTMIRKNKILSVWHAANVVKDSTPAKEDKVCHDEDL